MISFVKRAKLLVTSIWTWCSLRWCNYYFLAAFQIILSLACVSRETHKLFPSLVNIGASGPITKYIRQTLGYFLLSLNLARAIARAQIDLASPSPRWVISFPTIFWKLRNVARSLLRVLQRMKASIDEFWPNTSEANYFEGVWTIRSKNRGKKTAQGIFACNSPSRPCLPHILSDTLQTRGIPSRLAFCLQSLFYLINSISKFMFASF